MKNGSNEEIVKKLFNLNAHLGHRKNRIHPKAKKFVYEILNGVSIIDLTKTVQDLETAKKFLEEQAKLNKKILLVATKKIINQFALKFAEENQLPHITNKWLLTSYQL